MPPLGDNRTLARHLKVLDWLKAELVGGVAALFKAMAMGTADAIADALSAIVLSTYVLGRRLGVPYAQLDLRVAARAHELAADGHEVERTYGDLSALYQHFEEHANG